MSLNEIAKKGQLLALIKEVSDLHGGDDPVFLQDYADELLSRHNLDDILVCFKGIKENKLGNI